MNLFEVCKTMESRGYQASVFSSAKEAACYLDNSIDGKTVAIGGSVTAEQMNLYALLSKHNMVFDHWYAAEGCVEETRKNTVNTEVYISSANALSESGEIVNIDGTGNRLAGTLFGHERVIFVIGKNKIVESCEKAIWRARNVAAPRNAMRLKKNTPCAKTGTCCDCRCTDRIYRAMVILWECVKGCKTEVILIDEDLGF